MTTATEQEVNKITEGKDLAGRSQPTDTIEYAVSQLLKEPESQEPVTPKEEPEDTETEVVETSEVEEEVTSEAESEEVLEEVVEEEEGEELQEEVLDYYRVKVDGEELEVTLDELQSGYQRQQDYTRKTQTLAEQRKAYEDRTAELDKLQQEFMNQAVLANEVLNRDLKEFEKVDWTHLKETDPTAYVQKQIELQDARQRQVDLQTQAQQVYEHNQKVQQAEHQKHMEAERKEALKLFPEWKDAKKAEAGQKAIVEFARSAGFTDQELAGVTRARDLLVLDKARKYDEIQAAKENITKKTTAPQVRKVVRPKGAAPKGAAKAQKLQEGQQRLRKSGSLKDAAALMHEMRSGKTVRK